MATNALATVDREKTIGVLRKLMDDYGPAAIAKLDHFSRAFKLADAIQQFRLVVREMMPLIMPLQGSALGFRTDKDTGGGYPPAVVEEAATEALLRGLTLDGNQWNIIGGRCYVTKAGMAVIVGNIPGLTDLTLEPGIPQFTGIGAVVDFTARWKMDGQPQSLTRKIPVKCQPAAVDAAIGKATRKMLAAIYEKVTGSSIGEGEVDEPVPPPRQLPPAADAHRDKLKAAATADDLRAAWDAVPNNLKPSLLAVKDQRKAELSAANGKPAPAPAPAPSPDDLVKIVERLDADTGEGVPRILVRVCGWHHAPDLDSLSADQRRDVESRLEAEIEAAESVPQ